MSTHWVHALFLLIVVFCSVSDSTGHDAPTDHTTATNNPNGLPVVNLSLWTSQDRFYAVNATVGSAARYPPNFLLTLSLTRDDSVLADESFELRMGRRGFNLTDANVITENTTDTYVVEAFVDLSQYEPFIGVVHVILRLNESDEQVSEYLAQPFDGLMGYNALTTYPKFSLSFEKTCSPKATMISNAGLLTLNGFDSESCDSFTFENLDMTSATCGPLLTVETLGLLLADKNYFNQGIAAITDLPDIYVDRATFQDLNRFFKAELFDGVYVVACDANPGTLSILIGANTIVELNYTDLIERIEGNRCVLHLRPSDGQFVNCTLDIKTTFNYVLGLPFLHRYCIAYDSVRQTVGIARRRGAAQTQICPYRGGFQTTTVRPTTDYVYADVDALDVNAGRFLASVMAKHVVPSGGFAGFTEYAKRSRDSWEIAENEILLQTAREIGRGAFAKVFVVDSAPALRQRTRQLASGLPASENATKVVIKAARSSFEAARAEMMREIDLMKDIGVHPHVVNLVGYVPLESPLIVMEYCANGDLMNYLRSHLSAHKESVESADEYLQSARYGNSEVTLKLLISFCWQIADGMTFLSSNGYVHRDLAARNILLTEDLTAKISDFGLCRLTDDDFYLTQRGGKLPVRWMAPEALQTGSFSTASDVWSYGILLYEIFSAGGLPYKDLRQEDVHDFLREGKRLEHPTLCPADVYAFMLECWSTSPEDRPKFDAVRSFFECRLEYLGQGYGYLDFSPGSARTESQ
ncbi:Protein F09A5.2 [Aphelenchoides avenae]|nr:Protein F09A5.2 [Aphelenchus avenae]